MRILTPVGFIPPVVYLTGLALDHLGRDTCHPRHVRVMSQERQGELQISSKNVQEDEEQEKYLKDLNDKHGK